MTGNSAQGIIDRLALILTADCNLNCSYCYQNHKKQSMSLDTALASLDVSMRFASDEIEVVLTGGEPLLEIETLKEVVNHFEQYGQTGKKIKCLLITNGLLLSDEVLEFAVSRDIRVQLSFDGVREAQDSRSRGTFSYLDQLLDKIRQDHPQFFERTLRVVMTITPSALEYFSDSIDYFLDHEVHDLSFAPAFTWVDGWNSEHRKCLDIQFDRILQKTVKHHEQTGEVPVELFRIAVGTSSPPDALTRALCSAAEGTTLAVDTDGQVYGCVAFAESVRKFTSELLLRELAPLRIGDIRDERFSDRLVEYRRRAANSALFMGRSERQSYRGYCRDCRYLNGCAVCPLSSGYVPGTSDLYYVPEFQCDFNWIALKYREQVPVALWNSEERKTQSGISPELRRAQDALREIQRRQQERTTPAS